VPVDVFTPFERMKCSMTSSNRRVPGYVPEAQWYPRLIFALALALGIVRVALMLWSEP